MHFFTPTIALTAFAAVSQAVVSQAVVLSAPNRQQKGALFVTEINALINRAAQSNFILRYPDQDGLVTSAQLRVMNDESERTAKEHYQVDAVYNDEGVQTSLAFESSELRQNYQNMILNAVQRAARGEFDSEARNDVRVELETLQRSTRKIYDVIIEKISDKHLKAGVEADQRAVDAQFNFGTSNIVRW